MWKVGKAGLAQPRTVPRQNCLSLVNQSPIDSGRDWRLDQLQSQQTKAHIYLLPIIILLSLSTCQDMTSLDNFRCQKNQLLMSCTWITWNSSHFSTLDPWQSILRRTRGTHQQCALGNLSTELRIPASTRPTESWTPKWYKDFHYRGSWNITPTPKQFMHWFFDGNLWDIHQITIHLHCFIALKWVT